MRPGKPFDFLARCAKLVPPRVFSGRRAHFFQSSQGDLVQHSQNLDTLAAAYAEAGKFEHAITTQEKAIAQLKKEGDAKKLIDKFIEHLKSYRNHKPWREKPKTMKE